MPHRRRTTGRIGIASALLAWYDSARRDLPWRRTSDPWAILISEFMLQQTRVETVLPYYRRFLERFPAPADLAAATDDELLSAWAGLGYYSRARNLRAAAEVIAAHGFPRTLEGLRGLPGVGPYTAAAVGSIAFGLPAAVVDGNVLRVVARLVDDASDIALPATRQRFGEIAQDWLDPAHPGDFNQAVMELGATVCLPRQPQCLLCPLAAHCRGRAAGTQAELPVKRRPRDPVRLERTLALVTHRGRLLLRQRPEDASLMPGFWELPDAGEVPGFEPGEEAGRFSHSITHHRYRFRVLLGSVSAARPPLEWVGRERLNALPLTTVTKKALAAARKVVPEL